MFLAVHMCEAEHDLSGESGIGGSAVEVAAVWGEIPKHWQAVCRD